MAYLNRDHVVIDKGDYMPPRGDEVAVAPGRRHLDQPRRSGLHCETSSGILNPVEEIAEVVHAAGRRPVD